MTCTLYRRGRLRYKIPVCVLKISTLKYFKEENFDIDQLKIGESKQIKLVLSLFLKSRTV